MRNIWLENLKLSPKEKIVLEVLQGIQLSAHVTRISEKSGLPRSTVLYILRKLEKTKLVKKISGPIGGKRFYWRKNIMLLK